ncbi:MAG TPA: hypothetical protein VF789_33230 [Thermoanaerobaculia bacterium]
MSRVLAAVLILPLLLGCGKKPAEDDASIKKNLEEKGTIDLMDQVSKAPDYQPPVDGRLTEDQVEMYLAVRKRELRIREVALQNLKAKGEQAEQESRKVSPFEAMKAVGDLADVATADLRAAQELGHNPKELQWVKERVLEAQVLATTRALNQQVARSRESLLANLEEQKRAAASAEERAEIDRRIAELKSSADSSETDPAGEHNSRLLARYEDELASLKAEEERIARKMETNPGDER